MTDCEYCSKPSLAGDVDGIHEACSNEWNMRVSGGICIVCGKNDAVSGERKCEQCWDSLDFQGYPGP